MEAKDRFNQLKASMQAIYNNYFITNHGLNQLIDYFNDEVEEMVQKHQHLPVDQQYSIMLNWNDLAQIFHTNEVSEALADDYDKEIQSSKQLQKFIPNEILHSKHGSAWIEMYLVDPFNPTTMIGSQLMDKLAKNGYKVSPRFLETKVEQPQPITIDIKATKEKETELS